MLRFRGFTLLELIFVVAIIGILASIAMPVYNKAVDKAGWQEAIINLKLIRAAELVYFSEHNTFFIPTMRDPAGNQDEIQINNALHINLPTSPPLKWWYFFDPYGAAVPKPATTFQAWAYRDAPHFCIWIITESTPEPWCSSGTCWGG